ncbi:MAG: hypothetical protein U0441_22670 [Polyangiaceae bacterium]
MTLGPNGPLVCEESHQEAGSLFLAAHRTSGGTWECDDDDSTRPYPVGDQVLRIPSSGAAPTLSGRRLPLPDLDTTNGNFAQGHLSGHFVDDLWLSFPDSPAVLHYNGRVWEDRSPGVGNIQSLTEDASGDVWVVTRSEARSEWNGVLRWDRVERAWSCFPVPSGLRPARLLASNDRDVWLFDAKETYHWNGASFQRGPTPIPELHDAWISRDGELWIVGGASSRTPSVKRGLALRTRIERKP